MAETINMPKLGFDMAEGLLVRWVKQVGETINKGDVLAEIESDKYRRERQQAGFFDINCWWDRTHFKTFHPIRKKPAKPVETYSGKMLTPEDYIDKITELFCKARRQSCEGQGEGEKG